MVNRLSKLPKRYDHFVFSVVQSCLTCAVAAAIAHASDSLGAFVTHWMRSWFLSWVVMMPVVLLAAPVIRRIVASVIDDGGQ